MVDFKIGAPYISAARGRSFLDKCSGRSRSFANRQGFEESPDSTEQDAG